MSRDFCQPEALAAWRETGSRVGDPDRAARHFVVLVTAEIRSRDDPKRESMTKGQVDAGVDAGVAAFLTGYAARPRQAPRR